MAHLKLQHHIYSCRFQVPADVRDAFEGRREVVVSLKTADKRLASLRAAPVIAKLKAQVAEARGRSGSMEAEAIWWRDQIAKADEPAKGAVIDDLAEHVAKRFGVNLQGRLAQSFRSEWEALTELGGLGATRFLAIAQGKETPLLPFIESWSKAVGRHWHAKSLHMAKRDVSNAVAALPLAAQWTTTAVFEWLTNLGTAVATQRRTLSHLRSFWSHLRETDIVPATMEPLRSIRLGGKRTKAAQPRSYVPFTPAEVADLYKAAAEKDDNTLANLILLAAYTGARIEELCALKVDEICAETIRITDSKTAAGLREVPIHPKLAPLIADLKKHSTNGYLLSGLQPSKYGDRSNAIGKRFGRLKTSLGFTRRAQCFHSIRKTVSTQLEQGGVSENVAADILGHEKPRITYGLYSGGTSLAQKQEAIATLRYPT